MEKIELFNNILADIGNFVLVIFGFSVTLFTVLYSFILSKKEQLIEYSDKIKKGNEDFIVNRRESNAKKIIDRLKKINNHLIIIIFVDFIIYVFCMGTKYIINSLNLKEPITIALGFTALVMAIYVFGMLIITVSDYLKITKT